MTTAIVLTSLFFLVYMLVREPFCRLPLHIDTGFYISNHVVAAKKLAYAKGWNAHYAGCSKLIPEMFYSFIYTLYGGGQGLRAIVGPCSYKQMSRRYASIVNFGSAIGVGLLSCYWSGGDMRFYYAGLIGFALLSSEHSWGGYFECAELLEIPAQIAGLLCLTHGVETANLWWVFAGACCWAADVFFIKLSSAIAFGILFGGLGIPYPSTLLATLAAGVGIGGLYVCWVILNGRRAGSLLQSLWGHEANYGQGGDWRRLLLRIREKTHCVADVVLRQPMIPVLAVVGLLLGTAMPNVYWLFLAGVTTTYVVQAANCRYYMLPLLPLLAIPAASSMTMLASAGLPGLLLLTIAGVVWLMLNPIRACRLDEAELNRWTWDGFMPTAQSNLNVALDRAAEDLAVAVSGKTLLVYGPLTQAYALIGASYSTPIVTPEYYLDDVCPGWQRELNERLVASPPAFILDTSASFDALQARTGLGLDYRLTHVFGTAFRLFSLVDISVPDGDISSVVTHRPVAGTAQEAELRLGGEHVTIHDDAFYSGPFAQDGVADEAGSSLRALLAGLRQKGHRRLAVYGAGRFTIRHVECYRCSPVPVAMILDDDASRHGGRFLDWPVCRPEETNSTAFDGIVVSTDRFAGPMLGRIRRCFGDSVPAYMVGDRAGTKAMA